MIFTVGHSNHTAENFAAILRDAGVEVLMDVRSHPTSRHPQFWGSDMARWLPRDGIRYEWEPGLGGWAARHRPWFEFLAERGSDLAPYLGRQFPKQAITPTRVVDPDRPSWTNAGLYSYSWFTALAEFNRAAEVLLHRGQDENIAICCAEVLWWKCHRSLVADYLEWRCQGADQIAHLMPRPLVAGWKSKTTLHRTYFAERLECYDPQIVSAWAVGGLRTP